MPAEVCTGGLLEAQQREALGAPEVDRSCVVVAIQSDSDCTAVHAMDDLQGMASWKEGEEAAVIVVVEDMGC